MYPTRSDAIRPIAVAIAFSLFGEVLVLLIWGVYLFPSGALLPKIIWTMTCGVGMGATIGALVNLVIFGRPTTTAAALWPGLIFFGVLAYCTFLCFNIDLAVGGLFGAQNAPTLFIAGGLAPALAGAALYSWLLSSDTGVALLSRLGL